MVTNCWSAASALPLPNDAANSEARATLLNTFMIISFDCCADFFCFMQYSLSALAELPYIYCNTRHY
jgi:hypothetical protein